MEPHSKKMKELGVGAPDVTELGTLELKCKLNNLKGALQPFIQSRAFKRLFFIRN